MTPRCVEYVYDSQVQCCDIEELQTYILITPTAIITCRNRANCNNGTAANTSEAIVD